MDEQMVAYRNYSDLCRIEREGLDYRIRWRKAGRPYCVMAPHGGGIEPGTSEISDAIAGDEHSFYAFEGLKVHGNADHLPHGAARGRFCIGSLSDCPPSRAGRHGK